MMLGAINPQVMRDRIVSTASDSSKLQTFATNTSQVVDPSKGVSPLVQPPTSEGTDYMSMIKKYAPYLIGAVLLYYVISKK